jgi:uncharacterized protein
MSFLVAEWRKLAMANYAIDPQILAPYVPKGTELDFWNGQCYVSLVGFMFKNTRLLGIPIPFHTNFEEVNLRFYVKCKKDGEWRRGVVFIKEIVPKPMLTLVANTAYREHYETLPMKHEWLVTGQSLQVSYSWKKAGNWHRFTVQTPINSEPILPGSETEFITEHYWGYTQHAKDTTFEYEVTHPTWESYPVLSYEIAVDYGAVYGSDFAFLSEMKPSSVLLAEGSAITVEGKRKL